MNKYWVSVIKTILKRCDMLQYWERQAVPNENVFLKDTTMKLKTQYEKMFFASINKDIGNSQNVVNKLRTYAKIKSSYHLEEYIICDMKPKLNKLIAQIRLSSHDHEIVKGRRCRPKPTPAEQRFCHFCKKKGWWWGSLYCRLSNLFWNSPGVSFCLCKGRVVSTNICE